MSDIVVRLRYIAEQIRPIPPSSLRNAASEIERLKASLQLAQRWAAAAADALQPSAEENTRLRAEGAGRYWEGRWRDADKEIERLKAALREAQAFLAAQPDGPRNDVLAVVRAALEGK